MNLELAGKVAVVTGASRGIGLAITRALVGEGVCVTAGARDFQNVGIADNFQAGKEAQVQQVAIDLSTPDGPIRLVDEAVSTFGALDILVNNVGAVHPRTQGFLSLGDDEWMQTLNINFMTAVRTTRAALPHLLDRQAGSIVTVCSVNATLPDPGVIDYSAAKGALLNFCKALSKEVGQRASA